MDHLKRVENSLAPYRSALLDHPIYGEIKKLDSLGTFMEHHVFAVWDFMSLLKTLQRRLCCVNVPWLPPPHALASRFINDIVLAEESDEDENGGFASHFELYHRAMKQSGADTHAIDTFLAQLQRGVHLSNALADSTVPQAARRFVKSTFEIIENGSLCEVASVFAFGREDLLPDVFSKIVDNLNSETGGKLERLKYYLQRHIELDGDNHGAMATELLQALCGEDEEKWAKVQNSAIDCLSSRKLLWDGVCEAIIQNRGVTDVPGKQIPD